LPSKREFITQWPLRNVKKKKAKEILLKRGVQNFLFGNLKEEFPGRTPLIKKVCQKKVIKLRRRGLPGIGRNKPLFKK